MSNCSNFGNGSLMFDISPGRDGNDIPIMSPKLIMHALCHIFNGVGLCLGESSNLSLFFLPVLVAFSLLLYFCVCWSLLSILVPWWSIAKCIKLLKEKSVWPLFTRISWSQKGRIGQSRMMTLLWLVGASNNLWELKIKYYASNGCSAAEAHF